MFVSREALVRGSIVGSLMHASTSLPVHFHYFVHCLINIKRRRHTEEAKIMEQVMTKTFEDMCRKEKAA